MAKRKILFFIEKAQHDALVQIILNCQKHIKKLGSQLLLAAAWKQDPIFLSEQREQWMKHLAQLHMDLEEPCHEQKQNINFEEIRSKKIWKQEEFTSMQLV